jgi:hypothetical protein
MFLLEYALTITNMKSYHRKIQIMTGHSAPEKGQAVREFEEMDDLSRALRRRGIRFITLAQNQPEGLFDGLQFEEQDQDRAGIVHVIFGRTSEIERGLKLDCWCCKNPDSYITKNPTFIGTPTSRHHASCTYLCELQKGSKGEGE